MREFVRRILMARLEFVRQAANDVLNLVLTVGALSWVAADGEIALKTILAVMSLAAFLAFLVGHTLLRENDRLLKPRLTAMGLRKVTTYGFWRGARAAWGSPRRSPLERLSSGRPGAATMGQLEAARLVVAPLFTLVAAMANVLLAWFANTAR